MLELTMNSGGLPRKRVRENTVRPEPSSAGHQLGQAIGDWWEEFVVLPMLGGIATRLKLFLDSRFYERACRGDKIEWTDQDGNTVDYDFVLELDGTGDARGTPVAFVESFWRRGARHSKDKARDDSGKLTYMRDTFPTARVLAITAAGAFTEPARDLVRSRNIDLFLVSKEQVIQAFQKHGLTIDYPDTMSEDAKQELAAQFLGTFTGDSLLKSRVAAELRAGAGKGAWEAFALQIQARLTARPTEISFVQATHSDPSVFKDVRAAAEFLENPVFSSESADTRFGYRVLYSDGSDFSRELNTLEELRELHAQLARLAEHMASLEAPEAS